MTIEQLETVYRMMRRHKDQLTDDDVHTIRMIHNEICRYTRELSHKIDNLQTKLNEMKTEHERLLLEYAFADCLPD